MIEFCYKYLKLFGFDIELVSKFKCQTTRQEFFLGTQLELSGLLISSKTKKVKMPSY